MRRSGRKPPFFLLGAERIFCAIPQPCNAGRHRCSCCICGRAAWKRSCLSCANSAFLQSSGQKDHRAKWGEAEGDWSVFSVSSVKSCPENFSLWCDGRGLLEEIVRVSDSSLRMNEGSGEAKYPPLLRFSPFPFFLLEKPDYQTCMLNPCFLSNFLSWYNQATLVSISDTKQLNVVAVCVCCSTKRFPGSIGSSAQILTVQEPRMEPWLRPLGVSPLQKTDWFNLCFCSQLPIFSYRWGEKEIPEMLNHLSHFNLSYFTPFLVLLGCWRGKIHSNNMLKQPWVTVQGWGRVCEISLLLFDFLIFLQNGLELCGGVTGE